MARKCKLTGRGPKTANNVSHSHRVTKRRQLLNLQKKTIYVPELGRSVTFRMSVKAMRTIDKYGLLPYMKKQGLTLKELI
jgi:large subunit ribosomal protein L28